MTDPKNAKPAGKGRPTPTRKEREQANLKPIVGNKSPEAKKAAKAKLAAERAAMRQGVLAGDERYLGPRDKGPQRRMARDMVDSRPFTLGEALIPALFIVIIMNSINDRTVEIIGILVLYGLLLGIIIDSIFIGRSVKRNIKKRYGEVERGIVWYAASRGFQMRPMRLPKPQVKRGTKLN